MRKVALALVGTVLGLVLLLSYKSHPSHPAGAVVAAAPSPGGAAPGASGPSPSAPAATPSTQPTRAPGTPKRSAPAATSRTVTGDTVDTDYGPVQVRITVVGTKITDVTALQLPNDRSRSREISGFAGPQLRSEALAAQSANIDAVSGASYTSAGYVKSLQSAIDRARA
jgi:uncharacterized protein with FMN-binding domain